MTKRKRPISSACPGKAAASIGAGCRICAITGAYCPHQRVCLYGRRDEKKKRINFCHKAIIREYSDCFSCPHGPARSARCDAAWVCSRTGASVCLSRRKANSAARKEAKATASRRRLVCRRVRVIITEPAG